MREIEEVNKFCCTQKVDTENELLAFANKLISKFGGKLIPSNEPKRNLAGFVWVKNIGKKEIVMNPVIKFNGNFDKLSEKLLKVNK